MSRLSFVFPGQGSQSVGMLADLAKAFPLVGVSMNILPTELVVRYSCGALTQAPGGGQR